MKPASSKTKPLGMRIPNEIFDRVSEDARTLRRTKASIITEVLEKHYANGKPTTPIQTKKAGTR
jgi:predicted DNA-binding protein